MIIAIEFAIILIIIASAITTKWKFKQENSILLTFLSTGIFTYVLGLINLMRFSIYKIHQAEMTRRDLYGSCVPAYL